MGMPTLFYRWYYGADSLNSLTHNLLRFSGIAPVKTALIGRSGAGAVLKRFERNFPMRHSVHSRFASNVFLALSKAEPRET